MNISFPKKQKKIEKPQDEVKSYRVWVRLYTIFTILHFVVLLGLSYFFRELVRGIDAPVEAVPKTSLPTLEVLDSKLHSAKARMDTKTHSLLGEVVEEKEEVIVPVSEGGGSVKPAR